MGLLSTTSIAEIDADGAFLLTSKALTALTSAQVKALTTTAIAAIDPNSILGFTAKTLSV